MSDKNTLKTAQKQGQITVKNCAGTSTKIEVFPAELFEGREGAAPGLYRLRVNRAWDMSRGKYTFYDVSGLAVRLGRELAGLLCGDADAAQTPPPDLPRGSRVRVVCGDGPDGPLWEKTFSKSEPFQTIDGVWRVFVIGRAEPVPVESLQILTAVKFTAQ